MIESDENLSPEGMERREDILRLAVMFARRRRRGQQVGRILVGCAAILVGGILASRLIPSTQGPLINRTPQSPISTGTANPSAVIVSFIETDTSISTRLAVEPQVPSWQIIDDDELLRSLADAGRPAGLIHINGETILLAKNESN